FVPAAFPPHKTERQFSLPEVRCQLVEAAIANTAQFEISKVELKRSGPNYMVDTLAELKTDPSFQNAELFLIIGADNCVTFQQWRDHTRILSLAKLAVYPRYESNLTRISRNIFRNAVVFNAPRMEISSSYVRSLVRSGKPIAYLVPQSVDNLIKTFGLYKQ
ncbi:MAG: nicotinate (nicotinamide) nucleotide adenylyltransferase, partial [bacterium]